MSKYRQLILLIAVFYASPLLSQSEWTREAKEFQKTLNEEYKDLKNSPLRDSVRIVNFKGHEFFEISENYRVKAKLIKATKPDTIKIMTSSGRIKNYDKYAKALFEIDGQEYSLTLYQSHRLRAMDQYKDYLFLPYKDHTNGIESYGGGRYIDLRIPEGDEIIIDFNQSYNPLCAYSDGYSCPIPPEENHLEREIRAGVKYKEKEDH